MSKLAADIAWERTNETFEAGNYSTAHDVVYSAQQRVDR